ncbi:Putative zinc-finger [Terribacillus halophilus]|uniref:Anti-sigma-W factor RsiW n=1 Tax=Terribacillus halophilus TaxID=361279 RepID=A0A1G6QW94_9BACI|nr:zf-HC2 domain-containing protein [Terribacillus halophilus]SDC96513.1 Putative zinc-finger [Terribacillus halophilus]
MNHNVFRDLVPNYLENLTSEDTNRQMEQHMEQCEDCQEYVNEMREDLFIERINERKEEKKKIDYLKKVRSKSQKKIFMIIGTLLSFFLVLSISYYFLFVHMWIADENNVQTTIHQQDNIVTVTFQSKKDNRYLLAKKEYGDQEYGNQIIVYESWNILTDTKLNQFSELAISLQDGTDITYTFLDENTLLLPNGEEKKLTDKDKLQIIYKNSTEEILLKDLYKNVEIN